MFKKLKPFLALIIFLFTLVIGSGLLNPEPVKAYPPVSTCFAAHAHNYVVREATEKDVERMKAGFIDYYDKNDDKLREPKKGDQILLIESDLQGCERYGKEYFYYVSTTSKKGGKDVTLFLRGGGSTEQFQIFVDDDSQYMHAPLFSEQTDFRRDNQNVRDDPRIGVSNAAVAVEYTKDVANAAERADDANNEQGETVEDEVVECTAEGGFGWIACGVIRFVENVINTIYDDFIIPFLRVSPLTRTNSDGSENAVYSIWKQLRTVANVLLVPAFFVIIFAQALSLNIDAYTVKKMLPRLVAAVILIQFSYFIVSILVDIFNVLGNGIGGLILGVLPDAEINFSPIQGGFSLAGTTLLALATVKAAFTGALFLVLVPFLLTVLAVFFTLVFRQLLIILLAIVAPVAFVLMVLPNTEKYFRIWGDFLIKALVMYPLIVLLFVAGEILASLATNIGTSSPGVVSGSGPGSTIGIIVAIAAIIIPMAMIPLTFRFAGTAIAGVIGGLRSLGNRGMGDEKNPFSWRNRAKSRVEDRKKDFEAGRGRGFSAFGREFRALGGTTGQRLAHPLRTFTRGQRARMAYRDIGVRSEEAKKDLEGMGANTLPAARAIVRGRQWVQEQITNAENAGRVQEADNWRDIMAVTAPKMLDAGHINAAVDVLSNAGTFSMQDHNALVRRYGDSSMGAKALSSITVGNRERTPYGMAVDYNNPTPSPYWPGGQAPTAVEGGVAARAVRDTDARTMGRWHPDQWAYALVDEFLPGGARGNIISDAQLNELETNTNLPNSVRDMIREVRAQHAAGSDIEGLLNSPVMRTRFGMSGVGNNPNSHDYAGPLLPRR